MKPRFLAALALLLLLLVLAMLVSAGVGAYWVDPWRIPSILWHGGEDYPVLAQIRFPRILLGAMIGACLAISGTSLQGLFRNPLASPGLIGVTSGASLGAALWIVLIKHGVLGFWGVPLAAFAGSAATTFVIWGIAKRDGVMSIYTLLLAGIAVNAIVGAGIGLLKYISDDQQLRSMTFWMMGDLRAASWWLLLASGVCSLAGMILLLPLGNTLNALALGESEALHLGIDLERVKWRIVLGAALAVGAAVAAGGQIGFIGLVVPHLLRLAVGADHRWLLPGSALGGAFFLVLCDLASRTVAIPLEVPVGILTSAFGGPFFLWLLLRQRRMYARA